MAPTWRQHHQGHFKPKLPPSASATQTLTFVLGTDLGLKVFGVDVLVSILVFRRPALPAAEAATAAAATAGEEAAAYGQRLG